MSICEIQITEFQKGGISRHDLEDELTSVSFVAKTFFELGKDFLVGCVFGGEDGGEGSVFASETVEEVSDKDPGAVCVDAFLDGKFHCCEVLLELGFRQAV